MLAVVLCALVTACSSPAPTPSRDATPTPSATATEPPPVLIPAGTADDNKPFFDLINSQTLAATPEADGRAFIDGLAAAGFDKAAMEVTSDTTTLGQAADSIMFSVRWGEECLIGQNGPGVGGYHSTVQAVLGTGKCLVGATRPIDW
ncbi:hypothetical protein GCM10027416_14560 [Okibacterium endophyticum]